MSRPSRFALLAALVWALPALSRADILTYTATLSGPAESPPNLSPGNGLATVTVDTVTNMMRVQVTFANLRAELRPR